MRNEQNEEGGPSLAYVERVNRAIDHILAHLAEPLPLEEVAEVAGFSPFHFHRVFRSLVGETLGQFVKRVRLERSLAMLSHGRDESLTQIALACGFSSSSDYSRSFKQRYGVAPSAFDVETFRAQRREEWQAAISEAGEQHRLDRLPAGENPDGFEVELRRLPARTVAYIRVLDPYKPDRVQAANERLMAWADARGIGKGQWLGYMWDDPEIVAHELCRYDVGLEVDDAEPEGEIGRIEFPAMLVAQVEIRGSIELEMRAIDWVYRTWLPSSGFEPSDQPAFEAWIGRPFAHIDDMHFELHMQLPLRRL